MRDSGIAVSRRRRDGAGRVGRFRSCGTAARTAREPSAAFRGTRRSSTAGSRSSIPTTASRISRSRTPPAAGRSPTTASSSTTGSSAAISIERGVQFRTDSDTEVVLNALVLDGPEALKRFRGMFALLLWDAETRVLLAARDQIGVKPLYYTVSQGAFVAASELRTLIAHPAVKPELDPANVVEYLSFGFVAGAGTLLDGVFKLEPGHFLVVKDGAVRVAEYWDALSAEQTLSPTGGATRWRSCVKRSMRRLSGSLVSDVPVSLMLSGGLDSSAIAALATHHVPAARSDRLLGLVRSPDGRIGCRRSSRGRSRHAAPRDPAHRESLWPRGSTSGSPTWISRRRTQPGSPCRASLPRSPADGNKVLLGGDGADELFGGYNRWMTYLRFHDRYWSRIPAIGRRVIGLGARPFARGLAGDIARRARNGGQLFVGSRPFHDDDLRRYLGPVAREAARAEAPESHVEALRERFDTRRPGGDQLAWMSYVALKTDLVEDYLVRLDTMGMRHSVEGRVPLLDVDLVELCILAVPESQGGATIRAEGAVPAGGFFVSAHLHHRAVPSRVSARPSPTGRRRLLRSRVGSPTRLIERGLITPDAVELLSRRRSVKASFALWALGTLSVWCDTNLS